MDKIIGIASGKGGVGKTTTAINLSAALKELDIPNIIIDANLSNANLSLQLGFQYIPVTLQDVLSGSIDITQAIRIHPTGLRIIPASISLDQPQITLETLKKHIKKLKQTTILDFPPGIGEDVRKLIKMSDEIIIVTNPEITAVTDALKTIELARREKKVVLGIVLNRVKKDKYELSKHEIESLCEIPVIAEIPEDKNIRKANFFHLPVIYYNPYSKASIAYFKLASMITGKRFELPRFWSIRRLLRI